MNDFSLLAGLPVLSSVLTALAADRLKAFLQVEIGVVRYVLRLQRQADGSAFKVKLTIGKTVRVDAENRFLFGGEIESEIIQGWGYACYLFRQFGPMAAAFEHPAQVRMKNT